MSKERLEEIAYNVGVSLDGEKALMSSDDYDFLYNYALQQAERVQELEDIIYQDERQAVLEGMYEQKKRYREALEHCKDILKENREINKNEYSSYITGLQEGLEFAIDEFEKALESESE